MDAKQLFAVAGHLFEKKRPLDSLLQECADNFFPERADFTIMRPLGTDFASNLMSSYPVLCRRDLQNQLGTMLRPTAKEWFHPQRRWEKDTDDNETRATLQWMGETMRRAMYDPVALFTRATKEGDGDFACFGQCALSAQLNRRADALLYRCWHLRDMAWQENEEGQIGTIFRKWKPTAQTMLRLWKEKVAEPIRRAESKTPFEEYETMHMVVETEMYDKSAPTGIKYWSIWYDALNDTVLEETALRHRYYVIPRWQTVSGSQYSFSPATVAALPDARLIQAMTFTLLEAGEKATQPPMIATQDAVRSDVSVYAGGITWVDPEYDERLGEALRPITQDFRGFNFGLQMNADTRKQIHSAFYLDALTLPERAPEMTAYEVGQRVQEYIRNALPLFEPMEAEYNSAICDLTFEILLANGAFGNPGSWPKALRGAEVEFVFESPLHDAIEEQKGQKYTQATQLIAQAISLDPGAGLLVKGEVALRDALNGIGVPARWLNNEQFVEDAKRQMAQQQAQQQQLANLVQGTKAAQQIGIQAPPGAAPPAAAPGAGV